MKSVDSFVDVFWTGKKISFFSFMFFLWEQFMILWLCVQVFLKCCAEASFHNCIKAFELCWGKLKWVAVKVYCLRNISKTEGSEGTPKFMAAVCQHKAFHYSFPSNIFGIKTTARVFLNGKCGPNLWGMAVMVLLMENVVHGKYCKV